jgi:hypothetical protein
MKTVNAIKIISDFRGKNLKIKLDEIKLDIIGKGKSSLPNLDDVFDAAVEIKRVSAQIDEIVHATGIIKCLNKVLKKSEIIKDLSLASGADGEGIDVVTNLRIAEFKFAKWQSGKGNGMRKRQVFADLVNLYLNPSLLKKELYVYDSDKVIKFFSSKKSSWKKVLSKSGGLDDELKKYMKKNGLKGKYLNDIYSVSNVSVRDIGDI